MRSVRDSYLVGRYICIETGIRDVSQECILAIPYNHVRILVSFIIKASRWERRSKAVIDGILARWHALTPPCVKLFPYFARTDQLPSFQVFRSSISVPPQSSTPISIAHCAPCFSLATAAALNRLALVCLTTGSPFTCPLFRLVDVAEIAAAVPRDDA